MNAEACIRPDCTCKAYKDPGRQKGTLLLLRLCCKQCGHHGSEHRRLTAVDALVREEVERAAGVSCTHLIPLSEIPHSPVFQPHDPIPIPYESSDHDQGNTLQCTCTGFRVPSLVKLWQTFRTYSMSAAIAALPKITCSMCQHTLQSHQQIETLSTHVESNGLTEDTTTASRVDSSLDLMRPHLTLKASAKLALTPHNFCVQILPPASKSGKLVLASLCSVTADSQLHVAICSLDLAPAEPSEQTSNLHGTGDDSGTTKCEDLSGVSSGFNQPECSSAKLETEAYTLTESSVEDSLPKRRRRRKRIILPGTQPRKSARLQKQTESREALENRQAVAKSLKVERECREREVEQAGKERQRLCGCVVEYVSSVEKKESFTHYPLPEAVSRCTIETMAVTESGGGVVLGLGATSGAVFVAVPAAQVTWVALDTGPSATAVKCLSWLVECADQLCLCAGYSDGSVAVWKTHLIINSSGIEHSVVGRRQDTKADITLCSWAPDKELLAVGSQMGEVLLYSHCSEEERGCGLQLGQTVQCSGSAITCATWMESGSVLAVGGTDDSIQILQRKQAPPTRPGPPTRHTQPSLLSYFKPVDSDKFIHTHWLRGHCSFVSSLVSPCPGTLLSLGWDGRVLFWHGIDPIKCHNTEVFPIEDSDPHCGFKLGPSTTTEFLPLAMSDALGFGVLVLLRDRGRDVHLAYYTFSPLPIS